MACITDGKRPSQKPCYGNKQIIQKQNTTADMTSIKNKLLPRTRATRSLRCFFVGTLALSLFCSCGQNSKNETPATSDQEVSAQADYSIEGSWQMVYAEIREKDSVQVKDLSNTRFIKIINADHFAFVNQENGTSDNFSSGAGRYSYDGKNYIETLEFVSWTEIRGHDFHFEVSVSADSLIQHGHELVEEAGMDRYILEKYVRIKK